MLLARRSGRRADLETDSIPAGGGGRDPRRSLELYYRPPTREELTAVCLDATAPAAKPALNRYGPIRAAATPKGPVLLGKDLLGRIQIRSSGGRLATRTQGAVALETSTLRTHARHGILAIGLGADAHP